MKTIVIPQFYRGPSGQKGLYNRQEVGLARAFAALGCRAVVLYPEPGAKAPRIETPEPNVKICYMPAVAFGVQAFYKSWQILLDEHADAVHVMGDNSLGVPGLYRFCQKHGILFYSQLGALKSTSNHAAVRRIMDLLLRRNLAVYRKTPTYAKTPAVAAELESLGVPCAGLMPVGWTPPSSRPSPTTAPRSAVRSKSTSTRGCSSLWAALTPTSSRSTLCRFCRRAGLVRHHHRPGLTGR